MDQKFYSPLRSRVNRSICKTRILVSSLSRPHNVGVAVAEGFLQKKNIWPMAIGTLLALQLVLVFNHEPWLDEYQALLIALQSADISSLLENLHYEGHPPVWYLLLQGMALIVPPLWVLPGLQALIAVSLQLTILLRSPFSHLERMLLGSSAFVLFEYGTLSRSLSLGVLMLTLFFAFRHRRISWLAIAVLPMADFLFGVLSIACIAIMAQERRLSLVGLGLWACSSALAAWSVYPASDMVPAINLNDPFLDLSVYVSYLSVLLIPLYYSDGLQWNMPLPVTLAPSVGFYFLVFCFQQTRKNKFHLVLLSGFIVITAVFSIYVYPLQIRHLSLIAYFLILLNWRDRQNDITPQRGFALWLATISGFGLMIACINLARPFDTAHQAAQYIRQNKLEKEHWLSFPEYSSQGISALLGIEFQGLERECTQSFVRWNNPNTIVTLSNFKQKLFKITSKYGSVHMITNTHIANEDNIRLIKYIKPGYDGQPFYIYKVNGDGSHSNLSPSRCTTLKNPIAMWRD